MKAKPLLLALTSALALATPFACGGNDYMNSTYSPPTGTGGFDPGTSGPHGTGTGTGTGVVNTTGSGGTGGSGPPMCDDSLKRCDHVFTYVGSGNESTVEVRGDWAAPSSWNTGVPMTKTGSTWSATVPVPYNKDVQYKLVLDGSNWILDPANPNTFTGSDNNTNSLLAKTTCDPWTCATPPIDLEALAEWKDAVMYFVFVDRFNDGNTSLNGTTSGVQAPADYQGGDYAGVTAKINAGYFNSLGVNLLWLTVPMDNTDQSGKASDPNDTHLYSAYHGYWPKNLDQTENHFGTMADLKALVDAAHTKNIKVIIDYAMNHVHVSSPVYQAHQNDGWFWPNQNPNNASQNCVCGQGCSWDPPEAYRCWFTSYLPDFNFGNQAARDFSVGNAIWWLQQTGADGFRLDAVKHIDISWLYSVRARAISEIESTTMKHVYMVGETFTGDRNLIKQYIDPAQLLDGQFDFPLREQVLKAVLIKSAKMSDLKSFMDGNDDFYGPNAIMSTFIGNHDVPRVVNFAVDPPNNWNDPWYGGANNAWSNQPGLPSGTSAFERLAVAYGAIFTNKGIPLIYYGDEIGMPGGGDPDNRRMMQWSGYSAGQQLLLDRLKKLGAARAAHESLRRGSRTTLAATDDVWAYKMTSGSDTVCVVLNRSDASQQVQSLNGCPTKDAISGNTFNGSTITAPARSVIVLTP
ncbi:Periplasmic alpha-amylase [Minicystis rosea]|nr:Periplasmic alpha-amylase [Minicystis rosea]